jgi:hypothetical protein
VPLWTDTTAGKATTLFSEDGTREHLYCGPGYDEVYVDERDTFGSDCEQVFLESGWVPSSIQHKGHHNSKPDYQH